MLKSELPVLGCLSLFGILCLIASTGADSTESQLVDSVLGAHAYSLIISAILLLICVINGFLMYRSKQNTFKKEGLSLKVKKSIFYTMIGSVIYVIGIIYIGFYVSTIVFVPTMYLMQENWNKAKYKSAAIFAVSINVLFYIVFTWLHIYLPSNLLF